MPVSGGRVTGLNAKKFKNELPTGLSVNIEIKDVSEEGGALKVEYEHKTDYKDGVAEITVEGEILVRGEDNKAIIKKWGKEKALEPKIAEDVLNAMNYAAAASGTLLAFGISVNAPLNLPRARVGPAPVTPKKKQNAG